VISFPWQLIILSNPEGICVKGAMLVVSLEVMSHVMVSTTFLVSVTTQ
jgi:hypothetical protein